MGPVAASAQQHLLGECGREPGPLVTEGRHCRIGWPDHSSRPPNTSVRAPAWLSTTVVTPSVFRPRIQSGAPSFRSECRRLQYAAVGHRPDADRRIAVCRSRYSRGTAGRPPACGPPAWSRRATSRISTSREPAISIATCKPRSVLSNAKRSIVSNSPPVATRNMPPVGAKPRARGCNTRRAEFIPAIRRTDAGISIRPLIA